MVHRSTFWVLFLFPVVSLILINFSCKKAPGEGGAAAIRGKLLSANYNSQSSVLGNDDGASDESVYIIYGDNTIPDHNENTTYDGSFEFKYLRPGTYTIFAYSLDKDSPFPVETTVSKTIEIKNKKETVEISDFIIYKEADKGGNSTIRGKVYSSYFLNYAPDKDVYFIFGNSPSYNVRIRTSYDGTYVLSGLKKGEYKIYVYSDLTGGQLSSVITDTIITANKQTITIPDLVVYK